ncbi:MAG TPA: DUF1616 domain-containing protein [Solirubrobacterales bacterium]
MRGHRDLRLICALALVCAIGSLIVPLGAVRAIFAVPLALILPGYAIAAAAFGSRPPAWPERLPLSLGVSLACLTLSSLVLNFAPGGIHGFSWALLLVLVVLLSCRTAARRRGPARHRPPLLSKLRPSRATAILGVGALAMAAAALILAQATFENDQASGYTQLWIASPKSTQIGITSEQQQTRYYRLVVEIEGARSPLVETFALEPSHTRLVTIPSVSTSSPVAVEVKLYLRSRPEKVYRRVSTLLQ